MTPPEPSSFQHLISIEPLGLLYGSAGRFLSPDNLVGRSGTSFPPSAATLSGLFAAHYAEQTADKQALKEAIAPLQLAGPFWGWSDDPQNFCVPTPMHCLAVFHPHHDKSEIPHGYVSDRLTYHPSQSPHWRDLNGEPPDDKFARSTWMRLGDWEQIAATEKATLNKIPVYGNPWQYVPHLHPRLKEDERRVDSDRQRGSLFLENGVQMHPDTCLVYLANLPIPSGWYRFGGEGHLAAVTCHPISETIQKHLQTDLGQSFALITPAVWGSNRLSYREPRPLKKGDATRHQLPEVDSDLSPLWQVEALLTQRPHSFRYRLGNRKDNGQDVQGDHQAKRLSRGRYAVSPGSVYITQNSLPNWQQWPPDWFPQEGPSLKRWGCGLALALPPINLSQTLAS